MYKRKPDIEALLVNARAKLDVIRKQYVMSLNKTSVESELKVEIKNFCENLRSVLDYLAHDIRETYCPAAKPNDRFYFPIIGDDRQYEPQIEKWYPGLKSAKPELWTFLKQIQPYERTENSWLGLFNRLNNENKHGALVPQTRHETDTVRVSTAGRTVATWKPDAVRFGKGVYIAGVPVDPATQLPVPHPSQTVERIKWVDFRFQDLEISALNLLEESMKGVEGIVSEISKLL